MNRPELNRITELNALDGTELLSSLTRVVRESRVLTTELLAHLAVADARRLHLDEACSSMHDYCVRRLGLDEETAWRYVGVARLTVRFPVLLEMLARGEMHVSGVRLLAPWLSDERANQEELEGLIRDASGKSRRELRLMLADRFPRRSVPSTVTLLTPDGEGAQAEDGGGAPGAVGQDAEGDCVGAGRAARHGVGMAGGCGAETLFADSRGCEGIEQGPGGCAGPSGAVSPLGAKRYHVQFTATEELVTKLEEAQALLSHTIASGDLPALIGLALQTLCEQTLKKRFGVGGRRRRGRIGSPQPVGLDPDPVVHPGLDPDPVVRPGLDPDPVAEPDAGAPREGRDPTPPKGGGTATRHIPADVRAAVYERDGGRCTFVDARGRRCNSREYLQIDHIEMVCRGGAATVSNCRLLCGPHNRAEARRLLGDSTVDERTRARRRPRGSSKPLPRPLNRALLAPSAWAWDDPLLLRILDALDGRSMSIDKLWELPGLDDSKLAVSNGVYALVFQDRLMFLSGRKEVARTDAAG